MTQPFVEITQDDIKDAIIHSPSKNVNIILQYIKIKSDLSTSIHDSVLNYVSDNMQDGGISSSFQWYKYVQSKLGKDSRAWTKFLGESLLLDEKISNYLGKLNKKAARYTLTTKIACIDEQIAAFHSDGAEIELDITVTRKNITFTPLKFKNGTK
jgi:hypothetical protein